MADTSRAFWEGAEASERLDSADSGDIWRRRRIPLARGGSDQEEGGLWSATKAISPDNHHGLQGHGDHHRRLGHDGFGLRVVDISDPTNPTSVGFLEGHHPTLYREQTVEIVLAPKGVSGQPRVWARTS